MADKNTLCETAVIPDGRVEMLSASSVNKLLNKDTSQSTLIWGIPSQGLENSAQSTVAREITGGEPGKLPEQMVISQDLVVLRLNVSVNNFSVMSGRIISQEV